MLQSDCAQELRTLRRGGPSAVTVKGRPKNKDGEGIEGRVHLLPGLIPAGVQPGTAGIGEAGERLDNQAAG